MVIIYFDVKWFCSPMVKRVPGGCKSKRRRLASISDTSSSSADCSWLGSTTPAQAPSTLLQADSSGRRGYVDDLWLRQSPASAAICSRSRPAPAPSPGTNPISCPGAAPLVRKDKCAPSWWRVQAFVAAPPPSRPRITRPRQSSFWKISNHFGRLKKLTEPLLVDFCNCQATSNTNGYLAFNKEGKLGWTLTLIFIWYQPQPFVAFQAAFNEHK